MKYVTPAPPPTARKASTQSTSARRECPGDPSVTGGVDTDGSALLNGLIVACVICGASGVDGLNPTDDVGAAGLTVPKSTELAAGAALDAREPELDPLTRAVVAVVEPLVVAVVGWVGGGVGGGGLGPTAKPAGGGPCGPSARNAPR